MRLARLALIFGCLMPVGCMATAQTSAVVSGPTSLYYYGGAHYFPASLGGYWCGVEEPHAHDFPPDRPDFYSYENHYYYFVGAPGAPYVVGRPPSNVHVKVTTSSDPHGACPIPTGAPQPPHTTGPRPTRDRNPAPATATPAPRPTSQPPPPPPPRGTTPPPPRPPAHGGHPNSQSVGGVAPPPRPHGDPQPEPPHSRDPNDARRLLPPPGESDGKAPADPVRPPPPRPAPDAPKQPPPSKQLPPPPKQPPPSKQPPPPKQPTPHRDPQDIKRPTGDDGKPGTPEIPKAIPKPPHPRPIETR